MNAKLDLPKKESDKTLTTVKKKDGPQIAPELSNKQAHDTMNHSSSKAVAWFRRGYPAAMEYM